MSRTEGQDNAMPKRDRYSATSRWRLALLLRGSPTARRAEKSLPSRTLPIGRHSHLHQSRRTTFEIMMQPPVFRQRRRTVSSSSVSSWKSTPTAHPFLERSGRCSTSTPLRVRPVCRSVSSSASSRVTGVDATSAAKSQLSYSILVPLHTWVGSHKNASLAQ
jgi:hypothetical protein